VTDIIPISPEDLSITLVPPRHGDVGARAQGDGEDMKRLWWSILIGLLLATPAQGVLADSSVSVVLTVTILPSPLLSAIEPGCAFVITKKSNNKATCTTTITLSQPTFQIQGWELMVSVPEVVDAVTGQPIEEKSVKMTGYSAFAVNWGQAVDRKHGPYVPSSQFNRTLDEHRSLIVADPGYGIGGYTMLATFELKVSPDTPAGTYVPSFKTEVANDFDGKSFH
jgi:hypothetical protein